MLVKELAALSGIKKQTIDSYLRENGYSPSAENAVAIARVLGVSVEYLVTGQEAPQDKEPLRLDPDMRKIVEITGSLNKADRAIVLSLANQLKARNSRN